MDFTLTTYSHLLKSLKSAGYSFQTFQDFLAQPKQRVVVMRHDVDRLPKNALTMAKIENQMGVKATYYFRIVNHVWNEEVIKKIVSLGHEIGYHYEDLHIAKGNFDKAILHFEINLKRLRNFYPVKTICMHGSPMSKWDNRELWTKYNYHDYNIIAEPYFDLDYGKVFYITDTGRSWNNNSISVRDRVNSGFNIDINNTNSLIKLITSAKTPNYLLINTHPHRWFSFGYGWAKELILQNVKNIVKRILVLKQ